MTTLLGRCRLLGALHFRECGKAIAVSVIFHPNVVAEI